MMETQMLCVDEKFGYWIDVLLRFRLHRVALIADVRQMYRADALAPLDKYLHRLV